MVNLVKNDVETSVGIIKVDSALISYRFRSGVHKLRPDGRMQPSIKMYAAVQV